MAKKKAIPNIFFLDEKLYKVLVRNPVLDELVCWDNNERRRVILPYGYTRENFERVYRIKEVAELVQRSPKHIWNLTYNGEIKATATYRTQNANKNLGWRWSPQGIMDVWQYFADRPWGRPRKDGRIIPNHLPTKKELRAKLNQQVVMYVKDSNGEFIPTWKA